MLAEIPSGVGANLARLTGATAGLATDVAVVLPVLARRAAAAMEQAAVFATAYGRALGDLPDAGDADQVQPAITRLADAAPQLGISEQEAYGLAEAWFTANDWVQPVLYLAQRKDVRVALPERQRRTAAADT